MSKARLECGSDIPRGRAQRPASECRFLEQLYQMVEACAGIQAPAPLVVVEKQGTLVSPLDGLQHAGLYYADPDLVLIDDSAWTYWSLKHETVHYLLHHALGNSDPTTLRRSLLPASNSRSRCHDGIGGGVSATKCLERRDSTRFVHL